MIRNKVRTGVRFKVYLFFAFVLVAGVLIGTLMTEIIPPEQYKDMLVPITKTEQHAYGAVFKSSFLQSVKPVIFMWILGVFGISVYCNMLVVGYKGGVLGFAAGALLKTYGIGKGMVAVLCGILPQYFVFIPVLMYICTATFEFSKSNQTPGRKIINYVLHLMVALMGCLFAALSDTYITSLLLRLCMNGE